jgi:predicted nucleic acid-binding protein
MQAGKRVVVDTNTIVSGILLPNSVPGRLPDLLAGHAGKADFLISGDGDVIELHEFEGIPILTARRYLAIVVR